MRVRVAVIGDLMIDIDHQVEFTKGPEGDDRFAIKSTAKRLGGAGAVAEMVNALCADVILAATVNVNDLTEIRRMVPGTPALLCDMAPTTIRQRFWNAGRQVGPRVDLNSANVLCGADQHRIAARVIAWAPDVVIICDHAQGVIGPVLMDELRAAGAKIFVDAHVRSDFKAFDSVECLTMNRAEAAAFEAAGGLSAICPRPKNIICKHDADGLAWNFTRFFPSKAEKVIDTIGAGDQFISTLAVRIATGDDWPAAIEVANVAAGIQVETPGIVPVRVDTLRARLGAG